MWLNFFIGVGIIILSLSGFLIAVLSGLFSDQRKITNHKQQAADVQHKQNLEFLQANLRKAIKVPELYTKPERPSWPETWMGVANSIAQRSYDPRLQVGSIIVSEDNTRVLSVGYNGNYKGGPNESESLKPGMSGMIHAEQNSLVKCDFNFPKKKHMYLTHSPCRACAKLIINAEISRVVYNEMYRDLSGIELLKSVGVEVYSIEEAILKAKS